jgi:hypothetical protein
LSSALEITVIDSDDPTAATTNQKKRVTLLPEGTTFSIPVELAVVVPTGVRESAGLFLKEGPWLSWSPTDIDLATSTLRVQTTHFSTWVALDYTAYPPGTYSASYIPSVGPASRASTGTPLTEAELAAELANALAQWRPALRDYDVAFNAAAGLPDIEIAFGPQPMNQQGQAYRWDQAIQLNDGRNPRHLRKIVVNSLFRWEGLNDPGVRDPNRTAPILVNLLAHELGHAIGIKHVSPSGDASLMGQGGLGIHPLALGLDERVAVGVVYGGLSNPPPQTYREAVRLEAASSLTVTGLSGGSVSELPTVRAVNSQGDPVPGVPVYFRVEGAESGTIAGTAGVTKDDGTFTLGQWLLASGTSAPQEIKAQAHLPSKLAQSDQEVTFIATVATIPEETSSVIGTVTSTQLGPLAGVTVTMAGDGASQSTVTSAPLGDYAFQEVKPGTATLSISNLPIGCTDPGPMVVVLIAGIPSHAHFSVSCQQQQSSLPVGLYFNSGLPLETSTVSYHNSTYELREGGAFESIHEQTEKFGQLAGHHRTVVTGTWNHLPRDQWFVLSAYCGSSLGGFIRIRQREIIRTYVSAVPGHEGETTVTRGLSPLDDTYAFCEAGGGLPALLRNSPLFVPSTYWGMR